MHMSGYTKLFNSILHSTIWNEDNETRIVWITMLAMADKEGNVQASIPGLAKLAGVSITECESALKKFQEPDKYSRTPDNEGRRIKPCDGGWTLLNHGKYRRLMSAEERREYNRQKQAEYRQRKRDEDGNESITVNDNEQCQHIAEADTKADTKAEADSKEELSASRKTKPKVSGYSVPECFESIEGFSAALAAWIEMRNKKRNPPTGHAIQLLVNRLKEKPDKAVAALNVAIESGWQTVKWEWIDNYNSGNGRSKEPETYRLAQTDKDVWIP